MSLNVDVFVDVFKINIYVSSKSERGSLLVDITLSLFQAEIPGTEYYVLAVSLS